MPLSVPSDWKRTFEVQRMQAPLKPQETVVIEGEILNAVRNSICRVISTSNNFTGYSEQVTDRAGKIHECKANLAIQLGSAYTIRDHKIIIQSRGGRGFRLNSCEQVNAY